MNSKILKVPDGGETITRTGNGTMVVGDNPIIPFIEGDGIGVDVTPVMRRVLDAAVRVAYGGKRKIMWMEVYGGEKAERIYGSGNWLPQETLDAIRRYRVAIKGPLTTPIGSGIRSLNVALRQDLDLYACIRPIRFFPGTPTPLKQSDATDMVIFRENTEDIYVGIEWEAFSKDAEKVIKFLTEEMGVRNLRFKDSTGIGVKPVSKEGSQRLIRMAVQHALENNRRSVTLVHKGNIMKFTEGAFCRWGYELVKNEFGGEQIGNGPWCVIKDTPSGEEIIVKDVIADNFLQQILLKPYDYDVIATLNLNGDYISDALAAQVGGIGIAPGANVSERYAVFEATHGSAPKYAGKNRVNPGSIILSGEMMLRHIGWVEAADLVIKGFAEAIASKKVTYDLARVRGGMHTAGQKLGGPDDVSQALQDLMPGAQLVTTSGFGDVVVGYMQ